MTSQGEKPISQIEVGDHALAYNQKTGKTGYYRVKAVLVHEDKVIEHLCVDGKDVVTTPEHPFYTREQGWVAAGRLEAGMHIQEADGEYGVVESFTLEHHVQRMFNLTVDEAHTFFVGAEQLLVHNTCDAPWYEPPVPAGMSQAQFGSEVMQWGTGYDAAVAREATITQSWLESQGVTQEMVQAWRDFYRNMVMIDPENGSAWGRWELLQHILDIWR